MQATNVNDLAKAFEKKVLNKNLTYPKKIIGRIENTKAAKIIIGYESGNISSGSNQLPEKSYQAFKKAVNLLKENSANPDFLTAFNVLINEGDFYIYPD